MYNCPSTKLDKIPKGTGLTSIFIVKKDNFIFPILQNIWKALINKICTLSPLINIHEYSKTM
jgi:hypothetical protein